MLAFRLAAVTLAVLLLTGSIQPAWGWHLGLVLFTLVAIRDLVSLFSFLLSGALLTGLADAGQAAYIALAIFTGCTLVLSLRAAAGRPGSLSRRHRHISPA